MGGSAGAAMAGALHAIRHYGFDKDPSKRCVVMLPDGVRNYMFAYAHIEDGPLWPYLTYHEITH